MHHQQPAARFDAWPLNFGDAPPASTRHLRSVHPLRGGACRYGGKTGENKVDFRASAPTLTGAPSSPVEASIGSNKGKFDFSLKVRSHA